jgi:hypothetical protein
MDKKLNIVPSWTTLIIIAAIVFMTKHNTYSQDFELAGVRYINYPRSRVNNQANSEFAVQEAGAFFNIPVVFKDKKTVLVNGLSYAAVNVNFQATTMPNVPPSTTLQALTYRLMLLHQTKTNWSLAGVFEPTLASDFKSTLSRDDLVVQSMVLAIKQLNKNFHLGAGLAYTTRFGNPMVVPLLPIRFKSGRHRINAMLPIRLLYAYELYAGLDIGLKAVVNGASFNVTGYSTTNVEINKINYTRANLGPVIYYRPRKFVTIEITGGLNTNRNLQIVDVYNRSLNNTTSTEGFINIGLVIKPRR